MKRLFLILLLLAASLPARAQDAFVEALPGLAAGFARQAETVERLGELGDPLALPVLSALSDGRLLKRADGTLLVRNGDAAVEAATGAPADAAGAEPVRINNRVRVALRGTLGRLRIVSPDPAERHACASPKKPLDPHPRPYGRVSRHFPNLPLITRQAVRNGG